MWAVGLTGPVTGVFMCLVCSVVRRLGAEAESVGGYTVKKQERCFYRANRYFAPDCPRSTIIYMVSATYSIKNCGSGPGIYKGPSCSRPVHEVNPAQYQQMVSRCTGRRLCHGRRIQATQADLRNYCNTTKHTDTVTIKWICVPGSGIFKMCPSVAGSKIGKSGILQNTGYPRYRSLLPPSLDCQCKLSVTKGATLSLWIVELRLNNQQTSCTSELEVTAPSKPTARFDCQYKVLVPVVQANVGKSTQVEILLTSGEGLQNGRYALLYRGTQTVNVTCGLYTTQIRPTTHSPSSSITTSWMTSTSTGHSTNTSGTPPMNKPGPTVTPAAISKEAVAGGVSGAVAVLLVLTAVILFMYFRRHPEKSCHQTKAVADGSTASTSHRSGDEGNRHSHLQISEPVLTSATNEQVVADQQCNNAVENVYAQPEQTTGASLGDVYQEAYNHLDKGGNYTSLSDGRAPGGLCDTHYTTLDHRDDNYTSLCGTDNAGLHNNSVYTPLDGTTEEGGVDNNIYYSIEARGMEQSSEEPTYFELETQPDNEVTV